MNVHFFTDKKDGQLITQIGHHEYSGIVTKTFDRDIDPMALLEAESKKDRILGRKLVCVMQLASQDIGVFIHLNKMAWSTLYFRKRGIDEIAVEVLL